MKDIPASQWYSVRHPAEYDATMEKARADGTLDGWTWGQLLGKWPPPGSEEWCRAHERGSA